MNETDQRLHQFARVIRATPAGHRAWICESVRLVDRGASSATTRVAFDAGYLEPGEAPPDRSVLLGPVNDGRLDEATDQELFAALVLRPRS